MQTIATLPVHSKDEHAIVRLLSADSAKKAVTIQTRLVDIFGDAIWLQQPSSLHITLMETICDTEYHGKTRQQYFQEWHDAYNEIVGEVLSSVEPFDISFTELLVSQRAIVIKSAESAVLNRIRQALLARIQLPLGTKNPPDITHCSLARFTKQISLEDAQRLTVDIPVNVTEHVIEFSLVRDLGPPDFNDSPMHTYPLIGSNLSNDAHQIRTDCVEC